MPDTRNNKTKKHITRIRKNRNTKTKGVDTLKYCGTIELKEDALAIQKKNEE